MGKKAIKGSAPRRKPSYNRREAITAWFFNTPYLLYSVIFLAIPLVWAIWLALTDWNLISPDYNFLGIQNFISLFTDENVAAAFWNGFKYLVPIVTISFVLALGIALLVSQLPEVLKGIAAVVFFIPYLISGVSSAVLVKQLLSYNSFINVFLRDTFGIDVNWLQSDAAFWILIAEIVWKLSGYYALFLLSGIASIPEEVHEAAALDGCIGVKKLFSITLPMITPTITSVIVLATGVSFQIFAEPYLLTGGGPDNSTTSWLLEIYRTSFVNFEAGYGAAMAIANAIQIFVVVQLVTMLMNRLNKHFGW